MKVSKGFITAILIIITVLLAGIAAIGGIIALSLTGILKPVPPERGIVELELEQDMKYYYGSIICGESKIPDGVIFNGTLPSPASDIDTRRERAKAVTLGQVINDFGLGSRISESDLSDLVVTEKGYLLWKENVGDETIDESITVSADTPIGDIILHRGKMGTPAGYLNNQIDTFYIAMCMFAVNKPECGGLSGIENAVFPKDSDEPSYRIRCADSFTVGQVLTYYELTEEYRCGMFTNEALSDYAVLKNGEIVNKNESGSDDSITLSRDMTLGEMFAENAPVGTSNGVALWDRKSAVEKYSRYS